MITYSMAKVWKKISISDQTVENVTCTILEKLTWNWSFSVNHQIYLELHIEQSCTVNFYQSTFKKQFLSISLSITTANISSYRHELLVCAWEDNVTSFALSTREMSTGESFSESSRCQLTSPSIANCWSDCVDNVSLHIMILPSNCRGESILLYPVGRDGEVILFKSNSLLIITITYNKKYFVTVTYYPENKVTVIILHIILLLKTTQQFSNNVSYSYQIEESLANEQHYT